jgi:hypothetical protein
MAAESSTWIEEEFGRILGVAAVAHDDFFALGGTSLWGGGAVVARYVDGFAGPCHLLHRQDPRTWLRRAATAESLPELIENNDLRLQKYFVASPGRVDVAVRYRSELFSPAEIERVLEDYEYVLSKLVLSGAEAVLYVVGETRRIVDICIEHD